NSVATLTWAVCPAAAADFFPAIEGPFPNRNGRKGQDSAEGVDVNLGYWSSSEAEVRHRLIVGTVAAEVAFIEDELADRLGIGGNCGMRLQPAGWIGARFAAAGKSDVG